MDASMSKCNGRMMVQQIDDTEECENLGVDLLKDLDLYMEDIEDRLTISRMVSDSVIKGIICAVEKEATENIAQKELELAGLKETLHLYHVGVDEKESIRCSRVYDEPKSRKHRIYHSSSDALVEHDRLQESVGDLKISAKKQFKMLKKELDKIKGSSSIRRKGSASELVGLTGILPEKGPDKWHEVDRMLDVLGTTLDSVHKQVENMVHLSKSSLTEWSQEREIQSEIERMVIKNCMWNIQEDFEERLLYQNSQSYNIGSVKWVEKIKEISCVCQELDSMSKSLFVHESGQLISHGSLERWKVLGNNVCSTTSLWEGNGKHNESLITNPEKVDIAQLKHLKPEELATYFKAEMTKMKRHHELEVQKLTEEYFSLKREYLKEKDSLLPLRKDKEFELLRKKIPEVILKLDNILVENEKLPIMNDNAERLDNLRDRLEFLHSENCQLRDLLTDKKKEIKCLSLQLSVAEEKMSEQSLAEANLLRTIATLEGSIEDLNIEASIREDLDKFILKEWMNQIRRFFQESDIGYDIMEGIYEVIFREAARNVEPTCKLEIEDSDMETFIMHGLHWVFLQEAFKEAEEKLSDLNLKRADERSSLQMELLEKEKALRLSIAEKESLGQEIILSRAAIDKKDKLLVEVADGLSKEKEKFEFACQELDNLRVETSQQQILFLKSSEELQIVKGDLAEALEKNELHKEEICEMRRKIETMTKNLKETAEEKDMLLVVSQEKQSMAEAREREHKKDMESIMNLVLGFSQEVTDFEFRTEENIKRNTFRLGNLSSQLGSLNLTAGGLRRIGLQYKQKLERRCSDLQKAEAEVDLLGDEVDTLLSLLEKIYIALDHYSPVLKHYPGIMEILKLVRRELSGESVKPV